MNEIVKSEMFYANQGDFYEKDSNEPFMTLTQLSICLRYSEPRKAISKLIKRNDYLKSSEFSVVVKLTATDGK